MYLRKRNAPPERAHQNAFALGPCFRVRSAITLDSRYGEPRTSRFLFPGTVGTNTEVYRLNLLILRGAVSRSAMSQHARLDPRYGPHVLGPLPYLESMPPNPGSNSTDSENNPRRTPEQKLPYLGSTPNLPRPSISRTSAHFGTTRHLLDMSSHFSQQHLVSHSYFRVC